MTTAIEWAEETINCIGGCSDASPGCVNCYSRGMSHRFGGMHKLYEGTTVNKGGEIGVEWSGRINTDLAPLVAFRNKAPKRIFMNSMSDWCHPRVSTEFIGDMWAEMSRQQQHTFMLLTKRPGRIAKVLGPNGIGWYAVEGPVPRPEPHIWVGTSVESEEYLWRIDRLRESPAAVRFLSIEPLLGPLPKLDLTGIHWVIVGGESGPRARPMHPDWVYLIADQCVREGVAFQFKQWGEWAAVPQGEKGRPSDRWLESGGGLRPFLAERERGGVAGPAVVERLMRKVGKKKAGRMLDGRTWDEYPETAT